MNLSRRIAQAAAIGLLASAAGICFGAGAPEADLRVLSSRIDTISGGNVLVQASAPTSVQWTVWLNGRDVIPQFKSSERSAAPIGLLTGLADGPNTLQLRVNGRIRSKLILLNHPITGPVFSGPHQLPFICQTEDNGLGPALDADCSAKTIVEYYYKSTEPAQAVNQQAPSAPGSGALSPGFKAYDVDGPPPSDVAQVVTSDGRTVAYIVRREIGVINRAVYEIQFLHQPGQPLPSPWTRPTPGWNGRLVYSFGPGCASGYRQGRLGVTAGLAYEAMLSSGYAVVSSTLTAFGTNCNDRLSAETLSMVKEHFIESYGQPVHTIGWGGSGGGIQQYLIAQNYPGLLDGILPSASFPDVLTTLQSKTDCALLDRAFKASTHLWSEDQKTAVSGFATWRTCAPGWSPDLPRSWVNAFSCDPVVPKELIYDPSSRPGGVRCDIFDNQIHIVGRNARTGFANRPLDNVGVQYGLEAFNDGRLDAEQFIELNERIGGYDGDGVIVDRRTEADPDAIRIAYQRGLVLTGGGGLSQIPIIDWRAYTDDLADNHDRFRSLAVRARIIAAGGSAANQVIWVFPRPEILPLLAPARTSAYAAQRMGRSRDLLRYMDRWLDNIAADHTATTRSERIARNKPADLADSCWAVDGRKIVEPASHREPDQCNQMYPSHADPRIAAGAPPTDDVLKCELKSVSSSDYSHALSTEQLKRLQGVFPTGVCDYSRPGVGQQTTQTTWHRY